MSMDINYQAGSIESQGVSVGQTVVSTGAELEAALARQDKRIFLKNGLYTLTQKITPYNYLELIGESPIKDKGGDDVTSGVVITYASGYAIEHITSDAGYINLGTPTAYSIGDRSIVFGSNIASAIPAGSLIVLNSHTYKCVETIAADTTTTLKVSPPLVTSGTSAVGAYTDPLINFKMINIGCLESSYGACRILYGRDITVKKSGNLNTTFASAGGQFRNLIDSEIDITISNDYSSDYNNCQYNTNTIITVSPAHESGTTNQNLFSCLGNLYCNITINESNATISLNKFSVFKDCEYGINVSAWSNVSCNFINSRSIDPDNNSLFDSFYGNTNSVVTNCHALSLWSVHPPTENENLIESNNTWQNHSWWQQVESSPTQSTWTEIDSANRMVVPSTPTMARTFEILVHVFVAHNSSENAYKIYGNLDDAGTTLTQSKIVIAEGSTDVDVRLSNPVANNIGFEIKNENASTGVQVHAKLISQIDSTYNTP